MATALHSHNPRATVARGKCSRDPKGLQAACGPVSHGCVGAGACDGPEPTLSGVGGALRTPAPACSPLGRHTTAAFLSPDSELVQVVLSFDGLEDCLTSLKETAQVSIDPPLFL